MDGAGRLRLLVLPVLGTALAACAGGSAPGTGAPTPAPTHGVYLDFEDPAATVGRVMAGTENSGPLDVRIEIVTADGGRVTSEPGVTGRAARFPRHADAPRSAALLVWPAGEEDSLAPGADPFRFGVDFRLDPVSADPTTGTDDEQSTGDNGDNLVQRGLFEDGAQYKLQVDHGVVSCRIAGDLGELFVEADTPVVPESWYRVACERDASGLTLSLQPWVTDDWGTPRTWTAAGTVGEIRLDPTVPLSIGAKTGSDAVIVRSASDQFNGVLDDVFVDLSGAGQAGR